MEEPQLRILDQRETKPLHNKLAVVTGSSRGIGRAIALALGAVGANVVGNCVSEKSVGKIDNLGDEIREAGVKFTSVKADITKPFDRRILLNEALGISGSNGGIDILVLNAAGGFERNKPYGWADAINNHSQVDMVEDFLPYLNRGGEIVYNTSHWAHGYGKVRMLPFYREVARTKHDAEQALLGKVDELTQRGIRLSIVSSPIVKGTGAYLIFDHFAHERLLEIEERMGGFPEASEVGQAVRDYLLAPHESGSVCFVRGYNVEPIPPEHTGQLILNREQIEAALPMYDNEVVNRVMVDEFESSGDRMSGIGRYTVRDIDSIGHFALEYGGEVFPAKERIEIAAQTLGLVLKAIEPDVEGLGVYAGFGAGEASKHDDDYLVVDFTAHGKGGFIFPGDTIVSKATITGIRGVSDIRGKVEMYVDGREVTTFDDIRLGIIPDKNTAVKFTDRARRMRQSRREKESNP